MSDEMRGQPPERNPASSGEKPEKGRHEAVAPESPEETAEGDLDKLKAELEEANRKGLEYLQLLQRVQADFVNYRRRVDQERAEQAKYAKSDVVLKLLAVLDDFERALSATPADQANSEWVQGIAIIERKLRSLLESEGVVRVEALGKPFDPWEHEAVLYEEAPGVDEGTVVEVFSPGYRLYDRVIRPAQVKVAKHSGG